MRQESRNRGLLELLKKETNFAQFGQCSPFLLPPASVFLLQYGPIGMWIDCTLTGKLKGDKKLGFS